MLSVSPDSVSSIVTVQRWSALDQSPRSTFLWRRILSDTPYFSAVSRM